METLSLQRTNTENGLYSEAGDILENGKYLHIHTIGVGRNRSLFREFNDEFFSKSFYDRDTLVSFSMCGGDLKYPFYCCPETLFRSRMNSPVIRIKCRQLTFPLNHWYVHICARHRWFPTKCVIYFVILSYLEAEWMVVAVSRLLSQWPLL